MIVTTRVTLLLKYSKI